ncbi:hypothetical protein CSA57_09750 [candidate division KSB3 bacterium]|nr:MAG: hypothetical protein CSA57_09750 [candidate division KSB3 bacterium]
MEKLAGGKHGRQAKTRFFFGSGYFPQIRLRKNLTGLRGSGQTFRVASPYHLRKKEGWEH